MLERAGDIIKKNKEENKELFIRKEILKLILTFFSFKEA